MKAIRSTLFSNPIKLKSAHHQPPNLKHLSLKTATHSRHKSTNFSPVKKQNFLKYSFESQRRFESFDGRSASVTKIMTTVNN